MNIVERWKCDRLSGGGKSGASPMPNLNYAFAQAMCADESSNKPFTHPSVAAQQHTSTERGLHKCRALLFLQLHIRTTVP